MSQTVEHLLCLIADLPGEAGVEVTVRGVFAARMTFGPRDGATPYESAALAAADLEPEAGGPRPGAFVSLDEAVRRVCDLIQGAGDPLRLSPAEAERVARSMIGAVTTGAPPESAVWCARLAPASGEGLVVLGTAFVWAIRMTAAPIGDAGRASSG